MTTDPADASKPLSEIEAFDSSHYESFDLNRLISFTVHWLQAQSIPTTFENIVVAVFHMFPTKFALEGYPEYPDAARINRALLQLGPKYRNWARGSVQKGFVLTEGGLREVRRVSDALGSKSPVEGPKERNVGKPRTLDLWEDLRRVELSSLFTKWAAGSLDDGTVLELLDMLNAYAYTPPRALRERLAFLTNTASQLGKSDLVSFLNSVRKHFGSQLKERGD